jgi:hypothetical protein
MIKPDEQKLINEKYPYLPILGFSSPITLEHNGKEIVTLAFTEEMNKYFSENSMGRINGVLTKNDTKEKDFLELDPKRDPSIIPVDLAVSKYLDKPTRFENFKDFKAMVDRFNSIFSLLTKGYNFFCMHLKMRSIEMDGELPQEILDPILFSFEELGTSYLSRIYDDHKDAMSMLKFLHFAQSNSKFFPFISPKDLSKEVTNDIHIFNTNEVLNNSKVKLKELRDIYLSHNELLPTFLVYKKVDLNYYDLSVLYRHSLRIFHKYYLFFCMKPAPTNDIVTERFAKTMDEIINKSSL